MVWVDGVSRLTVKLMLAPSPSVAGFGVPSLIDTVEKSSLIIFTVKVLGVPIVAPVALSRTMLNVSLFSTPASS